MKNHPMKLKQAHTPTPWMARASEAGIVYIHEAHSYARILATVEHLHDGIDNKARQEEMEANASFIVKAVNCHEKLLTALKVLQMAIESALGYADKAIAKAKAL